MSARIAPIEIVVAVVRERDYQDRTHGTIAQHPHTVAEWITIMRKELREAEDAWCVGVNDDDALREVLQVIATGFACLEQHGVVEREGL